MRAAVVAYPTDTLYGLGASVAAPTAIERVFSIKGRPLGRGLPVLVASTGQLDDLAADVPDEAIALAERFWPGGLTLVLKHRAGLPAVLTGGAPTVAIRQPSHPTPVALIGACGAPITGTSANRSGGPDPVSADQVVQQLEDVVDAVLDGGPCGWGAPSTVVDVSRRPALLLRAGVVGMDELQRVCRIQPAG